MTYNGVILTGMDDFYMPSYSIGPYRLRTIAKRHGYNVRVLDFIHVLSKELDNRRRRQSGTFNFIDLIEGSKLYRVLDKIISRETRWIGISTTFLQTSITDHLRDVLIKFREIKGYDFHLVLGGARVMYVDPHYAWKYRIMGYADNAFVEFLNHVNNRPSTLIFERDSCNSMVVDSNKNYKDIDMATLATEWLPEDYIKPTDSLPIEISRGCIFKCAFCYFPLNGKAKFDYFRVKEDMVKELQQNYERWGTTTYLFLDDTYNDSREKLAFMDDVLKELDFKIRFYTYIKPELLVTWPETVQQLVEQGIQNAALGVESRNTETRKLIGKGMAFDKIDDACKEMYTLSKGTCSVTQNYIIGLPKEPISEFLETLQYCINTEHVTTWNINAMSIQRLGVGRNVYASIIDQNPKHFGYEDLGPAKSAPFLINWRNEHTNFYEAQEIKEMAIRESELHRRFGGWQTPIVRMVDFDVEKHLNKTLNKDIPWRDLRMKGVIRVHEYYDNILAE